MSDRTFDETAVRASLEELGEVVTAGPQDAVVDIFLAGSDLGPSPSVAQVVAQIYDNEVEDQETYAVDLPIFEWTEPLDSNDALDQMYRSIFARFVSPWLGSHGISADRGSSSVSFDRSAWR